MTGVLTMFVAQVDGATVQREAGGTVAADSIARDSSVHVRWLSDANVLALVGTMNARQIAAADIILASWHSDTVRALAASLAREHAELQHAADSLATMLRVVPSAPALAQNFTAEFQTHIDSMLGNRGMSLDRAYVDQQAASHKLMADYLDQLRGAVQQPELGAWIESARGKVGEQLTRIQTQQRALVVADSLVADSLARRAAARRKR